MQVFVPDVSSFEQCVRRLDKLRLNKQMIECNQILRILYCRNRLSARGWVNHPAVLAWRNTPDCLALYAYCCLRECISRGIKSDSHYTTLLSLAGEEKFLDFTLPAWWGDSDIYNSHRARLLQKDYNFYRQYGWHKSILDWKDRHYVWPIPQDAFNVCYTKEHRGNG